MDKMTSKEASEYLGLSRSQVNRLVSKGILEGELVKAPVCYFLIDAASIEEYKNTSRRSGPAKGHGGRPRKNK